MQALLVVLARPNFFRSRNEISGEKVTLSKRGKKCNQCHSENMYPAPAEHGKVAKAVQIVVDGVVFLRASC